MMTSVISDQQREKLLATASEMDQRAAEIRARVTWSDENKHSKSAAEVIAMLSDPSTAELFVDQAEDLLIQGPFSEIEQSVWLLVNHVIANPNEIDGIDSDHVYSVVRCAIRKATQEWEN